MDPTFDDLIPGHPAYVPVSFDDLIPGHPAYVPPAGEVNFDALAPNQGASWPPSPPSARAVYGRRTIGNPMTGQEPQPGQTVWGAPISPDALPIGRTMAQYNAALDRSSEQQAYGADNGAVTYSSNPDGRPMIADDYVPGSDRPPISGESGAVGRGSLAPAGPAAPGSTALGVGAASNLSVPHNARRLADLDWSLGPIGVLQTQSFPVQPAPGPAGSRATEALSPQKNVGVFTLLTANPRLKNDPLVTSDRYDSHGALVRDFVDAKTGEVIGSASPYNGAGLQPLSDGLTFVRYDSGATSARALARCSSFRVTSTRPGAFFKMLSIRTVKEDIQYGGGSQFI